MEFSTAGGQIPYAYNWNFGDYATSTLPNPSHQFAKPGNYTAIPTVTDSAGDILISSANVTVSSASQAPNQPSNLSQMIAQFAFSNYRTILAGLGGVSVTLAGQAVFLAKRSKAEDHNIVPNHLLREMISDRHEELILGTVMARPSSSCNYRGRYSLFLPCRLG